MAIPSSLRFASVIVLLLLTSIAACDQNHIDKATDDHTPSTNYALHSLLPRGTIPNWNQTWITQQRAQCTDPFASEYCCPGYCSVDFNNSSNLFYTCCPIGFYAGTFGTGSSLTVQCCNDSDTTCDKDKGTKNAITPFQDAMTNVSQLEQACSQNGAANLASRIELGFGLIAIWSIMITLFV